MPDDLEVDDPNVDEEIVVEDEEVDSEEEVDDEEIDDDEEDSEEDDEEELEVEEDKPPSEYHKSVYKKIKGKYPDIFKEFPELKEVYFRENEFSTLFPTVEDAKVAASKVANFDRLAEDLTTNGSARVLVKELHSVGGKALESVALDFLPALLETDQNAYYTVVEPVLKTFVKNLFNTGKSKNNESVQAAALYALEFGWGHTDIDAFLKETPVDPALENERKQLKGKEFELEKQHYETAFNGINRYVTKILVKDITKYTEKIDDDYKKDKALSDIFAEVNRVLTDDPRHQKLMASLWDRSRASKYDEKSRRQIISTLLARAKQVMPEAARTIMAKANKTKKKAATTNNDAGGKVNTPVASKGNVGKVDMSKYKDGADFLRAYSENKGKVARIS